MRLMYRLNAKGLVSGLAAEIERQVAFFETAGPADILAVVTALRDLLVEETDPRVVTAMGALARLLGPSQS